MFLLEKIELFPFSPSEEEVVRFILAKREEIKDISIQKIADACYTSKSTLVRISKKLGFEGWKEFKDAFLKEIDYLNKQKSSIDANIPFTATDTYLQIANNIAKLKKEAIDDTSSLLEVRDLNQAIRILQPAQTIHIFAASNNLLNAQEFAHNMSRIQKDVRVHQLQGEIHFNAYLAHENSCAIIISYSGGTTPLIRVSNILRSKNIPIIAMTSLGDNPISQLSNVTLRLATKERLYSKIGTYSTDTSITYLLDVLYSCIFAQNYQHNLTLRQVSSQFIESERFTDSSILQEPADKKS
ncbi:TPA: MurR/RpiR family transcriptional regulator [Streptococcus suis]